jgi:hypothetical protein
MPKINWDIELSDIVPEDEFWVMCPVSGRILCKIVDLKIEKNDILEAAKEIDCGR